MRQGGRRIENEAGWYDRGCREEEKRQGRGSRVWRWKSFTVKEEAGKWIKGSGRGLTEEAGRWFKGLEV
jgi:hypothetical protein